MTTFYDDDEPDWFGDEDKADDDGDDNNNEEDDSGDLAGSLHCLMMLDCGAPGMFEATVPDPDYPEDMISPFDYALQAAEQTVRAKIRATVTLRTGQRDAFGILLYNTCYRTPVIDESSTTTTTLKTDEDEEEEEPFAKIQHEFLPLQPPGVSTVQKIRQALDDAFLGRQRDLQKEYQPKPTEDNKLQTDPLQTALFEAGQIFGSCKYVRKVKAGDIEDSKQIWIFTTNDNPCEAEALPVVQQAFEDAKDNGIEIVVWPLPRKTPFDYSLFYDKVQATTPLRNSDSSEATLEELLGDMLRSWKKYRRAFPVPLLLPDWRTNQDRPGIALDVYRLIQVGRRPVNLPIHQQTGRMLSRIRQTVAKNGGGQVLAEYRPNSTKEASSTLKDRIRTFVQFGGAKVPMNAADKTALKLAANANSEFASLILLGFRDKDAIPISHRLEQTYYCYPSDERTAGSAAAFAHLHASMRRKGVLAIGELLTRATATSRLVAMWPLDEQVREDEDSLSSGVLAGPPGMMIVTLPFEEEVREIGKDAAVEALSEGQDLVSEELVEAAMKLVKKQEYGEEVVIGEDFVNSYISKFWDYVEHVALEQPLPTRDYDTIVDRDELTKVIGAEVETLVDLLPEDIVPVKAPRKRKVLPDESGVDWEAVFLEDKLDECKNAQLQSKLRSIGEKVGGRKQDLIDRLAPHLQKEFGSGKVKKEEV